MDQEEIYQHLWAAHDDATWDQSLHPRSPDLLFDAARRTGIGASWTVLDVGCGRGQHVCELRHRFGCRTFGLEPLEANLKDCAQAAAQWNVAHQVEFVQGSVEANPFASDTFDFLWCRDMLVHVPKLKQGLQECARVLKPGGILLVLTTFSTEFMEKEEQDRLCIGLGLTEQNLSRQYVELCFKEAGFQITSTDWLGSELAEFYEERDGRYSRELMRLARMNRKQPKFEVQSGQTNCAVSQALYTWGVYQLLGKLGLMVYTLGKRAV
jgi:ubiquinone/menaquinone biosynthesis C-methylase UbiE